MMRTRTFWLRTGRWLTLGVIVVLGLVFGPLQQRLAQWLYEENRPVDLPVATPVSTTNPEPVPEVPTEPVPAPEVEESSQAEPPGLPRRLNLDVPFTSQAPHGNWDTDHEEYCEEASALMAARFFSGEAIGTADEVDAALTLLKDWQLEHLGHFESTTAAETARMIQEVYGLSATVRSDVTPDMIKQALASNQLVLLPAAGRELENPYFQRPGPIYHMLVVKGYTDDGQFITNDPGTRRGADFVYPEKRLLNAVGDYNDGDPASGAAVMIAVKPR